MSSGLLGHVVQRPIKLIQDKGNFDLSFSLVSVFIYCLAFCFEFE